MKYLGATSDDKDLLTKKYVDDKDVTQATVANGVISYKNSAGTVLYTVTLPLYAGEVT